MSVPHSRSDLQRAQSTSWMRHFATFTLCYDALGQHTAGSPMTSLGSVPARHVLVFRCIAIVAVAAGLLIGEWYTTIPNTVAGDALARVLAASPWLLILGVQFLSFRIKSGAMNVAHGLAMAVALLAAFLAVSAYLFDCNHCGPSDENVENGLTLVGGVYLFMLPILVVIFGSVGAWLYFKKRSVTATVS